MNRQSYDAPPVRTTAPRWHGLWAIPLMFLLLSPIVEAGRTHQSLPSNATPPDPWPQAVVEALERVPIQAQGRIKPLHTFASYSLLRLNHRRSVKDAWGRKQGPMAWLLDALLRPEAARRTPCFLIPDDAVLTAIGLSTRDNKKKRDRYAYEDIVPARARLQQLGSMHAHREAKDRTLVETYIVELAHDVHFYEGLLHFLDFADEDLAPISVGPTLATLFPKRKHVSVVDLLKRAPDITKATRETNGKDATNDKGGIAKTYQELSIALARARALALIPPVVPARESATWMSPHDVAVRSLLQSEGLAPSHAALLNSLANMAVQRDNPIALASAAQTFADESRALAQSRGEYEKIDLEVGLAHAAPFSWAQVLYLLAFVLLALSWLWPNRWLVTVAVLLLVAGLAIHIAGITARCILRDRPPVTTLYETVLFVGASVVASCLVMERINRMRIALFVAPLLGALSLFIADRYEVLKGEDTMPKLVAVLDTNFWLTVHVLCITLGYAGALLASAIAHVYVVGRVLGRGSAEFHRATGRMVYGTLCFALLFSVVGTILGGIWANESWGRFWGWDPKENGALMIVLSQLMILHARMGGLIKTFGVAMATVASGIIVAFSWWGVNLLGIGLHSYGHTSGVARSLNIFYGVEVGVLLLGLGWWVLGRRRVTLQTPSS